MADFVELGIEGADKLIDKHFHKLPDSALQRDTYHPRNIKRKIHRRRHDSSSSSSETDSEDIEESILMPKKQPSRSGAGNSSYPISYPSDLSYRNPPVHSRQPPYLRPQYTPARPPVGENYPLSPQQFPQERFRDHDENYHSDSYRSPRRPRAVTRRSSSYHGRDRSPNSMQLVQRRRGSISRTEETEAAATRYGFKEEVEKYFTKSPAGMTGGVIGAVLGGWAAQKAQTAYGKPAKQEKGANPVLTLLGAAAGGLAVNALVDKVQHRNKMTEDKQEKWEEKFGSESESSDGESPRRGRKDREYRGENNGRGYQPYGSGHDR